MSTETTTKHLWEIDHPYYCSEGNFYMAGMHSVFESWAEFAEPSSQTATADLGNLLYDFDDDLNLLWRWDWKRADPSDYEYEVEADPDFEIPGDTLQLFFMLQRKAYNISAEVAVTEADEPAVREWLEAKALHMRRLWEPLLDVVADEAAA